MTSFFRWAVAAMLVALTLTLASCGSDDETPAPNPTTLVVWARGTQADFNLPIQVFVDQTSIGTLTANAAATATNPTGAAGTQLQVDRPAGTYVVRGVSPLGLVWAESITLTQGAQGVVLLDNQPASQGRVSFWAGSGGANTSNITVVLDGVDTLGTVSTRLAAAPACGATGTLTALRPGGTYRYQATSATGACAWVGQVVVPNDGACAVVSLGACNN